MAPKNLTKGISTPTRGVVAYDGSFAPNGSSAVAASSRKGNGFTVARTSAGLFTVTLLGTVIDFLSIVPGQQLTTGDDQKVEIGVVSASARTFQIRVWDISAAAVADVAAAAGNRIHFSAKVLASSVTPSVG